MESELHALPPEWLTIEKPITAITVKGGPLGLEFRQRSGGITNSRNRMHVPEWGIELEFDYEIDWTGNNMAGIGGSLSPSNEKLIVNSGSSSHLYRLDEKGNVIKDQLTVPHVTCDVGLKGFLRSWSWVDDKTLVGLAEITDAGGHDIVETRLYVFDVLRKTLRRVNLEELNLPRGSHLELLEIGSDFRHLKFQVNKATVIVKADFVYPDSNLSRGKVK